MTGLPAMSSRLKPGLLGARAVAERAEVVLAEPAMAAEVRGLQARPAHAGTLPASAARDRRQLLELGRGQRRHERRNRPGRGDAGQLGRVVQHARRAPGVAQVLERHEPRAQRFRRRPSRVAWHAVSSSLQDAGAMQPEPVVKPSSWKSRRCTIAGRSPMPLMTRAAIDARSSPSR